MVGMKFSLMMMDRICFQSVVLSPRSKQMDSRASLTAAGGLAMERTSTRCCFLMDLTNFFFFFFLHQAKLDTPSIKSRHNQVMNQCNREVNIPTW
uniref:Uncharacterized protein n=1 Tax=Salarias fasciatus TaxID=181472 RepID=A0A672J2F9_SALFA